VPDVLLTFVALYTPRRSVKLLAFILAGRSGRWNGPGNGIPYKVYCVQASRYANWGRFIAVSVLARLERFAPFWLAASALGMIFCERIQRKPLIPAIAHLSLWILGYAWYWSKIG